MQVNIVYHNLDPFPGELLVLLLILLESLLPRLLLSITVGQIIAAIIIGPQIRRASSGTSYRWDGNYSVGANRKGGKTSFLNV
jgi:Kef-type K+ transport system membrane component KefB